MAKKEINKKIEDDLLSILNKVQQRDLGLEVSRRIIMNLFNRYDDR